MHTKAKNILALLDAKVAEAESKNAKMAIRRVLLDGVKIIEPYRRAVLIANEARLMAVWVKMARALALKLKRSALGKTTEHGK